MTNIKKILASSLVCLAAVTTTLAFAEPTNLNVAKQTVIRYHDSGQYDKDIAKVIQSATRYLKSMLASTENRKMAIILDIDETSLSNYDDMVKMNFGGTLKQIQVSEDNGTDPVIAPTLQLYQFAKAQGVAVFFVTGRFEPEREVTAANLEKAGYHDWNGLYLRTKEYETVSAKIYKSAIRKKITDQGYHIIINIGDQMSDLTGTDTGKTFKLPNPYYFVP